jgi:hypothetical protein
MIYILLSIITYYNRHRIFNKMNQYTKAMIRILEKYGVYNYLVSYKFYILQFLLTSKFVEWLERNVSPLTEQTKNVLNVAKELLTLEMKKLMQKMFVEDKDGHIEITYLDGNSEHKIIAKKRNSSFRISSIHDHEERDITEELKPYLGPNEDFHEIGVTPEILGKEKLKFKLRNGETKEFKSKENIIF